MIDSTLYKQIAFPIHFRRPVRVGRLFKVFSPEIWSWEVAVCLDLGQIPMNI